MLLDLKSSRRLCGVLFILASILSTQLASSLDQGFCRHDQDDSLSILWCEGFESLEQLDFSWNRELGLVFDSVVLKPSKAIRFDRSIRLNGLKLSDSFSLTLSNFNGFEFHANPFNAFTERGSELRIVNSTLEFYYNGNEFTAKSQGCQLYKTKLGVNYVPLLAKFSRLNIESVNIDESRIQCSHIFQNSAIEELRLVNIDVGALRRTLLSTEMLENLKRVEIKSQELGLADFKGLAESLKRVQVLQLDLDNLDAFLQDDRQLSSVMDHQFLFVLNDSTERFILDEQSLCKLKQLSSSNSVFLPIIHAHKSFECDCAQLWLLRSFYSNHKAPLLNASSLLRDQFNWSSCQTLQEDEYQSRFRECSFTDKFAQCEKAHEDTRAAESASSQLRDSNSADTNSKRQNINFVIFAVLVIAILFIVLLIRWYTFQRLKADILNLYYKLTGRPRPDPHVSMTLTSFANPMATSFSSSSTSSSQQNTEEFSLSTMAAKVNVIDESND